MRRAVAAYCIFLGILLLALPLNAQWRKIQTFPSQVRAVYFLDQQGAATTGFVGLSNGQIWRTTNNGVTWAPANTPRGIPDETLITDFAFHGTAQGWCSVRGLDFIPGGLWTTVDGGLNWSEVPLDGNFVSVAYCAASGELVATNWGGMAQQSSDLGATWNGFAPSGQNGVTFSGVNGVMGNLIAPGFLYSNDGGVNWNAPNPDLPTECWSPYGISGTLAFFAVAERARDFFRSTDGGASWSNPYTFPSNAIPRGCVRGTLAHLFVQTSSGFYSSADQGNSWYSICGPVNDLDTRFYSKGTEIFSGDNRNSLWYIPDGTSSSPTIIGLDHKAFTFSGAKCVTYDSMLHFFYASGCASATLVNAQILTGSPNFTLGSTTLPRTIYGLDSIEILYAPSTALRDSGQLLLDFAIGANIVDTIIELYGTGRSTISYDHDSSLTMALTYACTSKDSILVIRNFACDTLTLLSASLDDIIHFTILPISLPINIAPQDSATVTIRVTSSHEGTFSSVLHLHMVGGVNTPIDDQVPLTLSVQQGAQPQFRSFSVSLLNRCESMDTDLTIINSQCDSIVLVSASLSNTSLFELGPVTLPMAIPANGDFSIPIHIIPGAKGTYTAMLLLRYTNGLKVVDTSIPLTVQVLYDIPTQVGLSTGSLNMGSVNAPCREATQNLVLTNRLCRDLSIVGMTLEPPNTDYWIDQPALPFVLKTDSTSSILVHFKPSAASYSTTQLRITLDLDGAQSDTVLQVSGQGISVFRDTVVPSFLQYDSLFSCQSQSLESDLINISCDSFQVTSLKFGGDNGYSVTSTFPSTLKGSDTLRLHFLLNPKHTGDVTDSAIITLYNPLDGKDYIRKIPLAGYVKPSLHAVGVDRTAFSFMGLLPCSNADSSILIRNLGTCDDIVITSTTVTGFPEITLDPTIVLPMVVPPGDSARIGFHIVPKSDTVCVSGIVLAGQNIDTTITVNYSAITGSRTMAVKAQDSIFATRPCKAVSKTYTIISNGCDSVTIDNIVLSGLQNQSQFEFGGLPVLPVSIAPKDSLVFSVQYDPNGNGDNTAALEVSSQQAKYSRSIPLIGSIAGTVPVARIALIAQNGSEVSSANSGLTTVMTIATEDGIGDSSGLNAISFKLHYNPNLLTKQNVVAPIGWTVLDQTEQSDGILDVKLHRDVSGTIPAGSELAECTFLAMVGDSTGCDITMSDLRFNDTEPDYERCVLSEISMPDHVRFTIADDCGTPILRSMMGGQLAFRVISTVPNPVSANSSNSEAAITFSLQDEGEVTVRILDVLGNEKGRVKQSFGSGAHSIPINLRSMPEGTYFAFIESSGIRYVSKIVVLDR